MIKRAKLFTVAETYLLMRIEPDFHKGGEESGLTIIIAEQNLRPIVSTTLVFLPYVHCLLLMYFSYFPASFFNRSLSLDLATSLMSDPGSVFEVLRLSIAMRIDTSELKLTHDMG